MAYRTTVWFPLLLLFAWTVAYLVWLRPLLRSYRLTAGLMSVLAAD